MTDDAHPLHPTAEPYRERARLVRHTAQGVRSASLRDDLLEAAREYDQLAESAAEAAENRARDLGRSQSLRRARLRRT